MTSKVTVAAHSSDVEVTISSGSGPGPESHETVLVEEGTVFEKNFWGATVIGIRETGSIARNAGKSGSESDDGSGSASQDDA